MKPLNIHVGSAAIGAGLALVLFLSAGAAAIGGSSLLTFRQTPTPAAFFRVVEGEPFVVPPGRALVITQLGFSVSNAPISVILRFDGEDVWGWNSDSAYIDIPSGLPLTLEPGIVATPGTVVTVLGDTSGTPTGGIAVALGYFDTLTPAPAP